MSDITVHIDETLDSSAWYVLQQDLSSLHGVEQINAQQHRPHLMVVKYDHQITDSGAILSEFHDHGYHAELIGF